MIKSFADKETERIFSGMRSSRIDNSIQHIAYRKLHMLQNSYDIRDVSAPPSNQLEKLKGKLSGRYSIRINDQYRICFIWDKKDAIDVEIKDYH